MNGVDVGVYDFGGVGVDVDGECNDGSGFSGEFLVDVGQVEEYQEYLYQQWCIVDDFDICLYQVVYQCQLVFVGNCIECVDYEVQCDGQG